MIAIAALTPHRVIGRNGGLPWHLPEDLKFFKRTTLGHVVLMGRATFDSIGQPLTGRENWVLTRGGPIPGARIIASIEDIPEPPPGKRIYLIGGAQVFASLLPRCEELLLTRLREEYPGDTYFPPFEEDFVIRETLLQTPDFHIERHARRRGGASN